MPMSAVVVVVGKMYLDQGILRCYSVVSKTKCQGIVSKDLQVLNRCK